MKSTLIVLALFVTPVLSQGDHAVMTAADLMSLPPVQQVRDFLAAAQRAGDYAELKIVPDVGHFETASPSSRAWPVVLGAIKSLLGRREGP